MNLPLLSYFTITILSPSQHAALGDLPFDVSLTAEPGFDAAACSRANAGRCFAPGATLADPGGRLCRARRGRAQDGGDAPLLFFPLDPAEIKPGQLEKRKPLAELDAGFHLAPGPALPPSGVTQARAVEELGEAFSRSRAVLLTGKPGSGKTHAALSYSVAARLSPPLHLSPHYVDCAALQQKFQRIHDLLAHVTSVAKAAAASPPSLLIVDSLPALCPLVDDTDLNTLVAMGLLMEQSRVVADHLLYVLGQCGEGGADVRVLFVAEPEATSKFLLERSGAVSVELGSNYDAPERLSLLSSTLSTRPSPPELPEKVSSYLAGKSESFLPRDMTRVADRLVFHAGLRRLGRFSNEDAAGITREDAERALEDYVAVGMTNSKLAKTTRTKWEHIGGLFESKRKLKSLFYNPIKYKKVYQASPIKMPKGCLLHGPSGCGKTMLGQAIAAVAGLNFISVKGPELLDKYIGASEAAVRDVWKRAEAAAPCLIFFDEFESLAARRGKDSTGVTDRVVNQLLTFLDGVEVSKGEIFVLAATSRMDMIDPALLRPGRLDVKILVGPPSSPKERVSVLEAVLERGGVGVEKGLAKTVEREGLLEGKGFSAADIASVVNAAYLKGVHRFLAKEGEAGGGDDDYSKIVVTIELLREALAETRARETEPARRSEGGFGNRGRAASGGGGVASRVTLM
ncbi:hypothetical protein TeGR_g9747 [Tetraparma gracilis]|uniref:AAA+ ATPase domain-containing protein n=1 Tax=Tetraparma gracilis TaxID=2962635 RepID=A0ABQ6N2A5_9STRA|nr:hypothetical protein TeGR_g9747 [Tetraparma gracilis]